MFQHEQFGGAQGAIITGILLSVQGARAIGALKDQIKRPEGGVNRNQLKFSMKIQPMY
jgi:hypothetical protein